jgi:putative flippase GtrA
MSSILALIRSALMQGGQRTLPEALRFLVIGSVCYGLGLLTLIVLVSRFGVHYLVANVLALGVTYPVGYWLNRRYNFKTRGRLGAEMLRYYGANIATFGVALGAVAAMVGLLHLNYIVANLIATAAQTATNFALAKCWVFRRITPHGEPR